MSVAQRSVSPGGEPKKHCMAEEARNNDDRCQYQRAKVAWLSGGLIQLLLISVVRNKIKRQKKIRTVIPN